MKKYDQKLYYYKYRMVSEIRGPITKEELLKLSNSDEIQIALFARDWIFLKDINNIIS